MKRWWLTSGLLLTLWAGSTRGDDGQDPGFTSVETAYHSGNIEIAATLLLPPGDGPFPAAVLIQGAGASSRRNVWSRMIGQQLTMHGTAAYLPDKRGTGDSGGDLSTAGFEVLANDISAAVEFLAARPEVDGDAIGVIGLSQGGFYAPAVAVENEAVKFVAAVSASALPFEETVDHEMRNTFREGGLEGAVFDAAMALQLAAFDYVRSGDWDAYEASLGAALELAPDSDAIQGFPADRQAPIWAWLPLVSDYDPMNYWRRAPQAKFFAYGELDEHDNVPVRKSVERIREELGEREDVAVRVYAGSGHALYDPVLAKKGEAAIRDDFGADLSNWIKRVLQD